MQRFLQCALHVDIKREVYVVAGDRCLAFPDRMLVAARVDADQTSARGSGEGLIVLPLNALFADHFRQVEVDFMAGQRLGTVASDVTQHMRGERALRVNPLGLHIDIHAGEGLHGFGPTCEGFLVHIAPGQQRHRQALEHMVGDCGERELARDAQFGGQTVDIGIYRLDRVDPAPAFAQFLDIVGNAVARPVVGQADAVAVKNPAARTRHLDPPHTLP